MKKMKIGFIQTSLKENERRLPLIPPYIKELNKLIRKDLFFESEYGLDYGYSDKDINHLGCSTCSRADIFKTCDIVVLPKPTLKDLEQMQQYQVLWGWPHCVQQTEIAQQAINKKLTLIAWEAMYTWSQTGEKGMHIFYRNNEIAGYAAVHHALNIYGMDGLYGKPLTAAVLSYGSVGRGAITALLSRGYNDITVYSRREPALIKDKQPGVKFKKYILNKNGEVFVANKENSSYPIVENLKSYDIICNGIMQDPLNPAYFVTKQTIKQLKNNLLIVDISCDEAMGFYFARPTSFQRPSFIIERNIKYYAVDHTPTYFYQAASEDISQALLPFIKVIHAGTNAWKNNETIKRAIEIQNGIIINPAIIKFQKRQDKWPYDYI